MKSVKASSATTKLSPSIKTPAKKKRATPAKISAKKTGSAPAAKLSAQDFNVHLVVPEGTGIDSRNVKITRKGMQLVIELQSAGGEASNQVEGVKKVPVPPRPHFPVADIMDRLAFKFTLSKKAVR